MASTAEVHGAASPTVLVVCTANQCRSPMVEALLRRALAERVGGVEVASAGTFNHLGPRSGGEGVAASEGSVRAMARRGLDLHDHRSRRLRASELDRFDLVVCLARSHAREVVLAEPSAWSRTFTLRELVRRGEATGARRDGEPLEAWLGEVGGGRTRSALLGADPVDDVADPIGGPDSAYEATAEVIEDLVERLVSLAFP